MMAAIIHTDSSALPAPGLEEILEINSAKGNILAHMPCPSCLAQHGICETYPLCQNIPRGCKMVDEDRTCKKIDLFPSPKPLHLAHASGMSLVCETSRPQLAQYLEAEARLGQICNLAAHMTMPLTPHMLAFGCRELPQGFF